MTAQPWQQPITLAIVGAEKAGTTALFRHLAQSPVLTAHEQREMTCFVNSEAWQRGEGFAQRKYFPGAGAAPRLMKDVMLMNFPAGLERLKSSSPGVKVLAMLREPAERAWSAYHYARSRGIEPAATFSEALDLEHQRATMSRWEFRSNLYLDNSTYADKIVSLQRVFGMDNTLVVYQSDYRDNPEHHLRRISAWLGAELFPDTGPELGAHNRAAQARSQTLAAALARLLRSQGLAKRALRAVMPQRLATSLRHGALRLNRVEAPNPPLPAAEARRVRAALAADAQRLTELLGRCPWADAPVDGSAGAPNG